MTVKRTEVCYWIVRPEKPGVQSSHSSRVRFNVISHTPCVLMSRFYHTHIMYKRNWDGFCLVNLIYFALHIFQIRNLLHCVDESWWILATSKDATWWRCGGRCCCYVVTIVTACSGIQESLSLHMLCDVCSRCIVIVYDVVVSENKRFLIPDSLLLRRVSVVLT